MINVIKYEIIIIIIIIIYLFLILFIYFIIDITPVVILRLNKNSIGNLD